MHDQLRAELSACPGGSPVRTGRFDVTAGDALRRLVELLDGMRSAHEVSRRLGDHVALHVVDAGVTSRAGRRELVEHRRAELRVDDVTVALTTAVAPRHRHTTVPGRVLSGPLWAERGFTRLDAGGVRVLAEFSPGLPVAVVDPTTVVAETTAVVVTDEARWAGTFVAVTELWTAAALHRLPRPAG